MKKFKKLFVYFSFYYHLLKGRLLILVLLCMTVGILDGFGLAMFLPLLEMAADGESSSHGENMGNLSFLVEGIASMGLELSLNVILSSMLVLFAVKGSIQFVEGTFRAWLRRDFVKKIRFQMIDGIAASRYQSFISMDAGMIQNTISGEVWRIINSFNHYFATFQSLILLVIYVFLAFLANAQFALLVACGGVLTNFIYSYVYKLTKKLSREITSQGHLFQSLVIQSVQYFKYLKATDSFKLLSKRLKTSIVDMEGVQFRMGKLNALLAATREPLIVMVVVIVILVQVNFLGALLSTIILSLLFFYRSLSHLVNIQNAYNNFLNNVGALENAKAFIADLRSNKEKVGKVDLSDEPIEEIRIEGVSFSYDANSPVLQNVALYIPARTMVAFVGESGSGKTSLINIMTGLLDTYSGSVLVNGKSLQTINRNSYQQKIGYITQESVIFTDTIFNNVTLWKEATRENIERFEKVLKQVALWEFYGSLPDGMNTLLGDYGQKVSGGQRQRISIARELYKNVEVLVMDEATAALDSETERIVQENIDSLSGLYTIIIIAHRLSTIKRADMIVLLEKGKIDSVGSYGDLIESSVRFRKMVSLQEV